MKKILLEKDKFIVTCKLELSTLKLKKIFTFIIAGTKANPSVHESGACVSQNVVVSCQRYTFANFVGWGVGVGVLTEISKFFFKLLFWVLLENEKKKGKNYPNGSA